jgi:hypothetical protein
VEDEEVPVLGYFQASGVSEQRMFIEREQLPSTFYVEGQFKYCEGVQVADHDSLTDPYYEQGYTKVDGPYYITQYDDYFVFLVNYPSCYDCTLSGGKAKEPDFWN